MEQTTTKRQQAKVIVKRHVIWAVGGGMMPLPLLDIAAVTAVQIDMLRQLADLYEVDYTKQQGKTFVSALAGSTFASLGASAVKAIPGIGTLIGGLSMSAFSGASTFAIGDVAAELYENGLDLGGDAGMLKKAYQSAFEKGKQFVTEIEVEEDDPYAKLEKLAELKEKGIVTEEEFEAKKKDLLDSI